MKLNMNIIVKHEYEYNCDLLLVFTFVDTYMQHRFR